MVDNSVNIGFVDSYNIIIGGVIGPNCKWSKKQAIKANREIWRLLQDKYKLCPSDQFGVGRENLYKLKELLKEIFVEDICNGW